MTSSRFAKWNLLLISILLALAYFWIDPTGRSSQIFRFAGRLHPAIVHLPIGLITGALILALIRRFKWVDVSDGAINIVLLLGSWAGLKAIFFGSWLAQTGGYPEDILFLHKIMGYGLTSVSSILLFLRTTEHSLLKKPAFSGFSWGLVTVWMVVGGDLGGQLTHGRGYVTEYAPDVVKSVLGDPDPMADRFMLDTPDLTSVFDGIVLPIFVEKCSSCHGATRGKGRLKLHTREVIEAHEGDEPLIVAGKPEESLLIQRVSLPEGHEDQMPPAMHAKPVSHADVELLKWWIASGASFDATIAETEMPSSVRTILSAYGMEEIQTGVFALDLPQPDSLAISALKSSGIMIDPVAEGQPLLTVRCSGVEGCLSKIQAAGLSEWITWLDLRGSDTTDSDLDILAEFTHLSRLNVSGLAVNGSGFSSLSALAFLEYVNAYNTPLNDVGLTHLASIKSITDVYLWQTAVTDEGVNALKSALPEAEINLGESD